MVQVPGSPSGITKKPPWREGRTGMGYPRFRSTTILCVQKDGKTSLGGDGQVSMGSTVVKDGARKIRRLPEKNIVTGFAGATADALTLYELFVKKVDEFPKNLGRAAVELAREWRTDRMLRRLEAMMIVADPREFYLISGTGDVIAPDDGILAVGSGGNYALSAARALARNTDFPAHRIVEESLKIAGEICIYTNSNIAIEDVE